jgi:Ala-tRNA(Pro) deacylase
VPHTPATLFAYLDSLGIAHSTVTHPPVFTVEQAKALRGRINGAHTKNLFLRDKKHELYLVVALESAQVDLKGLHRLLGANGRFSFGAADLLRETLGVEPGSVTPLAAVNDTDGRVTVVLDAPLMEYEVVNFHPLLNTMTTTLSRADLIKFLDATGHEPRIERLSGPAAEAAEAAVD